MAHNQFQFQKVYQNLGLRLKKCRTCGSFAQVDYYPHKRILIYCRCQLQRLDMERSDFPSIRTEEDFVKHAVMAWNRGEFDC